MAVQIAPAKHTQYKFSIEQYERMIETGILTEDDHVELIDGEIVKMASRGLRHEACVRRLDMLFHRLLMGKVVVSTQNSVRVPPNSQPEPDVDLLRWRDDFYESSRPMPEDTLLVIEVSDSTLAQDRGKKRSRYAKAGIAEYWIVNLVDNVIEAYNQPVGEAYSKQLIAKRGETLELPGGLQGMVTVNEILG